MSRGLHHPIPQRAAPFAMAMVVALLSACAIGPSFHTPAPPGSERYSPDVRPPVTASAATPGGAAQRFVEGGDVPADWWTLFHSPELDRLVGEALRRNPTVQMAQAALRQANEQTAAQRASFFPTVQAGYAASRQRNALGTLSPTLNTPEALFNLHTAQLSVSYPLDVFGSNRRQVESLAAQAEAQRFQLEATYVTLTTNVVAGAVQAAALEEELAAAREIVRSESDALAIFEKQYALGSIAMADVVAQRSALASAQATVPPLEKALAQAWDLLAALTGETPDHEHPSLPVLAAIDLPTELPVSLPSKLVRQRPDVRAAEAQLHAATAAVGVAEADLLPQFSLNGNIGSVATALNELFKSGTGFWSVGGSLSQTLFAGGMLVHRQRAAVAALDEAGAQYRSVVLAALQNVADTLHALDADAAAVAAQLAAAESAHESLEITRQNVSNGAVSFLAFLTAEQAWQQAQVNLIVARANRYADTAALFQALGGGWWNRRPGEPQADEAGRTAAGGR